MPILDTWIIFPNVANNNEKFFSTLYFENVILVVLEILFNSEKRERYFVSKLMNFTDFYDKLLKNLYDCNFTLNLVKKNDAELP